MLVRPNAQTYAAFMNAWAQIGNPEMAAEWLKKKEEAGLFLDATDCSIMMNAHANLGDVQKSRCWQQRLQGFGRLQVQDFTVLLKACSKAQSRSEESAQLAENFFREQLEHRIAPDKFNLCTLKNATGLLQFARSSRSTQPTPLASSMRCART